MSHDLYAAWATAEVSRMIKNKPNILIENSASNSFSVFANRESGRIWPIPDGRISAENSGSKYEIGIELKRTNEGLHGILTAIGQAQAYIHKGYSGAAIIIPKSYDSLKNPGEYITNVINNTKKDLPIGVFSYDNPDTSIPLPFFDKIICHKAIALTDNQKILAGSFLSSQKSKTQWAHVREGSTEAFAFMKYLQIAKRLNSSNPIEPKVNLPIKLLTKSTQYKFGPYRYLSNSPNNSFHDIVWRHFWFDNILTKKVANIWTKDNDIYNVDESPTELMLSDGTYQKFFASRSDSIKQKLVNDLNAKKITEDDAWTKFAININSRAHSYREDIDSGLEHLGLIEADGKPSELGYKYVDACERTGDCFKGKPNLILGSSLLKQGSMAAFLHYIYKVSEKTFVDNPLKFTTFNSKSTPKFDIDSYLKFVHNELANNINVMNTASLRSGFQRKPFQAEFAILRKFDFIDGFRVGVGLEINWPLIHEYLEYDI